MNRVPSAFLVVILAGAAASAKEGKPGTWEEVAKDNLSDDELALLRKNKFVIGAASYKQIFTPYVGSRVPVFITTDSLLIGFHVLFEESIYRMEEVQARKLPATLEEIWKNLAAVVDKAKGDAALLEAGARRARIFVATARQTLDGKAIPDDAALRPIVEEEVRRVVEGKETKKPAWLGPADPGFVALDYSRFLPRGFYAKTPALQRYFRAVSWLQAIPFRLEKDEELAAFLLLRRAWTGERKGSFPAYAGFWSAYRQFLGTGDDWDVSSAWIDAEQISSKGFIEPRERYRAQAAAGDGPRINDLLRFPGATPDAKPEISFRFLSAYRIPDAVLFQRTMKAEERDFPGGLEIAAALDSPFARKRLGKAQPKVLKEIDHCRELFHEPGKDRARRDVSLYVEYLRCLGLLLERTEPDAPPLFKSDAWKIKTCQTALAGWAQLRHTWALQAKPGALYLGGSSCPPGFVEPAPEFYGRFAALLEKAARILQNLGALAEIDIAAELEEAKAIADKARKEGIASLSREDLEALALFDPSLDRILEEAFKNAKELGEESREQIERSVSGIHRFHKEAKAEDLAWIRHFMGRDQNLAVGWPRLVELCRRLEVLAHKQLRQVPFDKEEKAFIVGYGKTLAAIMLYGGNSYSTPRDDAPRIVDIFSNPAKGKHLLVGTGKPRAFWILYPFEDKEVLCIGAVTPYHEFTNSERLTDAAWRARLRSPDAPDLVDWARPLGVKAKGVGLD